MVSRVGWIGQEYVVWRNVVVLNVLIKVSIAIDDLVATETLQFSLDPSVAIVGIVNDEIVSFLATALRNFIQNGNNVLVGSIGSFAMIGFVSLKGVSTSSDSSCGSVGVVDVVVGLIAIG